eukprot:331733-Lingulodinium_polyedra.AAC.1
MIREAPRQGQGSGGAAAPGNSSRAPRWQTEFRARRAPIVAGLRGALVAASSARLRGGCRFVCAGAVCV